MSLKIPTKKVSHLELPILGLGTWEMGGRYEVDTNLDQGDVRAIIRAIEAGVTHIDTAEIYASGHAEELVARALRDFDRSSLFITSKVSDIHLRREQVLQACKASLKRLNIDYLDLYLVHGPNPEVPMAETMQAMAELYEQGLIRRIGVSNFSKNLLAEARAASKYPIVNNQIHYSVGARDYEQDGTIEYCRQNDILVTAYRPLALGARHRGAFDSSGWEMVKSIGVKYGKTPVQVALNWVISKPGVVTLFKTSSPAHLEENLGALGWQLSEGDIKYLDENFPRVATMHPTQK